MRESLGRMLLLIAFAITALGVYAGLVQHDHRAGAVALVMGLGALLAGAALVRK